MDNITNTIDDSNNNPIDLLTKVALDFEQQNKTIEYSLDPFERLKQLQEVEQRSRVIRATQAYKSLKVYIADSDKNWKLKATEERKRRDLAEPLDAALYENNVLKGKLERREQLIKSMRKYINADILGLLLDAENDIENKKHTNATTTNSTIPHTHTHTHTHNNSNSSSNILVTRNVSDHSRDIIKKKVSYDNHLDDMSLLSLQDELISLKKTIQLKDSDIDLLKKRLEYEHNNKKDIFHNTERHELRILDEVKEIQAERNKLNLIITQKNNAFEKLLKSNETISNDLLEAKQKLNILDRQMIERNEELEDVKLSLRKVREERDAISNLLPDLNSRLDDNQKQIHTLEDSNTLLSQRYDRLVLELDKLVADGLYLPSKKEQATELKKQSMVASKKARVSPSVKGLLHTRKSKDASSDEEDKRSVSGKGARPTSLNSPTAHANNNDDIDGTKRVSFFERKKAEEELQQEKLKLNASMRINAALEHKMQEMKKKMDEEMVNISIREDDMKSRENDTRNTIMDLKQQKEESESKVRVLRMELQSIKNIKKEKPNTAVKSIQTIIKGNTIYDLPDDTINDQASGSRGVSGAWKSLVKAELAIYQPGAEPIITDTTASIDATSVDDNSITQTPKNAVKGGKKKKKTKRKSFIKSKSRVTMLNARSTSSNDNNDNDYDNDENDDGDDEDDDDDDDEYETNTKKAHRRSKFTTSVLNAETQTDSNDTVTNTNSDTNNGTTNNAKINKRPTAKQDFSLLLSSLKPLINQITGTSSTFLKDHGINDIELHSNTNDSTALAVDYINMISSANSDTTTPKWTTKLQLHPSDLYEVMDYIISIINTRNGYINGSTNHMMLLSVLDPILESLLYLLTRRLTKYNYNGYKGRRIINTNTNTIITQY